MISNAEEVCGPMVRALRTQGFRMDEVVTQKITALTGDNWCSWKMMMMDFLHLWVTMGIVTGKIKQPAETDRVAYADWKQMNAIACILIRNNISTKEMVYVQDCKTAAEIWDNLITVYDGGAVIVLIRTFFNAEATSLVGMRRHLADMKQKRSRLSELGYHIADDLFELVVLNSLPDDWDSWKDMYIVGSQRGVKLQQFMSLVICEAELRMAQGSKKGTISPRNERRGRRGARSQPTDVMNSLAER